MARRTWKRCKCGVKLHTKNPAKACYRCQQKERREAHV